MLNDAQLIAIPYFENSAYWFQRIQPLTNGIWLDSCHPNSPYGRFDILSAAPSLKIITSDGITKLQFDNREEVSTENPFAVLNKYIPKTTAHNPNTPFVGGALGYFSYDIGRTLEKLPVLAKKDIHLPEMHIGIYPWAIVQDHQEKKTWLVINHNIAPNYDFSSITKLCSLNYDDIKNQDTLTDRSSDVSFSVGEFTSNTKKQNYFNAIEKIQHYIHSGDCYQVNFAQRFSASFAGNALNAYLMLRSKLPSPFSAFIDLGDEAILSLSPERFIQLNESNVETKPIKGTIPRGNTTALDLENENTLRHSKKDKAENLMIVDLLRNDLSKTCKNVQVKELFGLQSFANVHHLVSTITAEINSDSNAVDLLSRCLPGGSITGAPKIRAMEIIEELEPVRRSIYCGCIGFISACGNMDTNIAIRTLAISKNRIHCWGGGGIVADSIATNEYQESITKVKVLMDTLTLQK